MTEASIELNPIFHQREQEEWQFPLHRVTFLHTLDQYAWIAGSSFILCHILEKDG